MTAPNQEKVGGWGYASIQLRDGESVVMSDDVMHRSDFPSSSGGLLALTNERLLYCPSKAFFIPLGWRHRWAVSEINSVGIANPGTLIDTIGESVKDALSVKLGWGGRGAVHNFFVVVQGKKHWFSTRDVMKDRQWAQTLAARVGLNVTFETLS